MKIFRSCLALLFVNIASAQIRIETNLPPSVAPNTTLNLEVRISKGSINSFSKYQMDVPPGVSIAENVSKTGNFEFDSPRAKLVWVAIPADTCFIVSFVMNTGSATGPGVINQKLFYVDESGKREFEAEPVNITIDPSGVSTTTSFPALPSSSTVASNNNPGTSGESSVSSVTSSVTNTLATSNPVTETKTVTSMANTEEKNSGKPSGGEEISKTKSSSSGLVFKVQLGAYGADPGKSKFAAAGKVTISKEDGLYKVLTGNFNSKEEALQKLETLKSKGLQGFVVKYQDGVRVK